MDKFDSFNAPRFIDFQNTGMDNDVDQFFDAIHENGEPAKQSIIYNRNSENSNIVSYHTESAESEVYEVVNYGASLRQSLSVDNLHLLDADNHMIEEIYIVEDRTVSSCEDNNNQDATVVNGTNTNTNQDSNPIRKSLSMGNLLAAPTVETLSNQFSKVQVGSCQKLINNKKSKLQNSTPFTSQERINQLARPKYSKSKGSHNFISIAEFINKYEKSTPLRFKGPPIQLHTHNGIKKLTIPCSPALQTKMRSRPMNILSQQEREQIEFENQQRFKIKAHPLNKKILQGPIKPTVPMEKKPLTVPEPFSLTEVPKKKTMASPKPSYEFHANPLPKYIKSLPRSKPSTPIKQPLIKAITPTFKKNFTPKRVATEEKNTDKKEAMPKLTILQPFSFDDRDKMIPIRRDQLIQKVLEEEREAREFHAKPPPAYISKAASKGSSMHSKSSHGHSEESLTTTFKAKPPTVLYKEPFVPKKLETPLTEPLPFQLNSQIRAQEREQFNTLVQQKQEMLDMMRRKREEERLKQEEAERLRIRKEMEFKARPIKKCKEIFIKQSNMNNSEILSDKENIVNN